MTPATQLPPPTPLAGPNQPVDWLLVYKFNGASFPGCNDDGVVPKKGTKGCFGGTVDDYTQGHSQQYLYATSASPTLVKGMECCGATLKDPLGATFGQVYNTPGYFYLVWNDQFCGDPIPDKGAPGGHSKGMLAWNADGEGFVLQVSTPSWPASGCKDHPRKKGGNTLGCIADDDDIEVAQHFFALKISKDDLVAILQALINSSVVTVPDDPSLVHNGGPEDVQALVAKVGPESRSTSCTMVTLSSGVRLISKPSDMAVPPWQLVSAKLGGVPLRVASWWAHPKINGTTATTPIGCWDKSLGTPGAVEIATTGSWDGTTIGFLGDDGDKGNHAKIGISTDPSQPLAIFGDENQQGSLSLGDGKCKSSQNGRGGTFYVLKDPQLVASLTSLLAGDSGPIEPST